MMPSCILHKPQRRPSTGDSCCSPRDDDHHSSYPDQQAAQAPLVIQDATCCGYESDETEVTSHRTISPEKSRSTCSTSNTTRSSARKTASSWPNNKMQQRRRSTAANHERWSSGDAKKPLQRSNAHPTTTTPKTAAMAAVSCSVSFADDDTISTRDEYDDDDHELCRGPEAVDEAVDNTPSSVPFPSQPEVVAVAVVAAPEEEEDITTCDDLKSKPGIIHVPETELLDDFDNDDAIVNDGGDNNSAANLSKSARTAVSTSSTSSSASRFQLTEEHVRRFMKDYYEDFDSIFRHGKSSEAIWESFFQQYYRDDILWVRSSSNTLKGPELAEHFAQDIVGIRMQLVSVDSIQLLGMTAVVVYTADQEFLYRGTPVSDRSVLSSVLHVDDSGGPGCERIRIAHEHRCTGKPIPKETRWES